MAEQPRLVLPQDGTVPLGKDLPRKGAKEDLRLPAVFLCAFAREISPLKEKERSPAVAELRSLNPHRENLDDLLRLLRVTE